MTGSVSCKCLKHSVGLARPQNHLYRLRGVPSCVSSPVAGTELWELSRSPDPQVRLSRSRDPSFVCVFVTKPARVLVVFSLQVTPVKVWGQKMEKKRKRKPDVPPVRGNASYTLAAYLGPH